MGNEQSQGPGVIHHGSLNGLDVLGLAHEKDIVGTKRPAVASPEAHGGHGRKWTRKSAPRKPQQPRGNGSDGSSDDKPASQDKGAKAGNANSSAKFIEWVRLRAPRAGGAPGRSRAARG